MKNACRTAKNTIIGWREFLKENFRIGVVKHRRTGATFSRGSGGVAPCLSIFFRGGGGGGGGADKIIPSYFSLLVGMRSYIITVNGYYWQAKKLKDATRKSGDLDRKLARFGLNIGT